MSEPTDPLPQPETRERIISKVYDAVLHPENTANFIAEWERYISSLSEVLDRGRNARHPSEMVYHDADLEAHFSRAHALLERFGRNEVRQARQPLAEQSESLAVFDQSGQLLRQSAAGQTMFGGMTRASELSGLLEPDARADWQAYFDIFCRAPDMTRFRVFALDGGGNLVAFLQRDPESDEVTLHLSPLATSWTEGLRAALRQHFALTNGELSLVENLTLLGSLDRLAEVSTRSRNTLRTQMKSVFQKLNVHSQGEVLQTVSMLSYFTRALGIDAEVTGHLPHIGRIELFDLERLGQVPVHFIGPEDGRPVIFLHGMLDGVGITPAVLAELQQHNLRLICPVRANFGSGPALADLSRAPQHLADVVRHLMDLLNLPDAVFLGHLSGSIYAFACAQRLGSRCRAVVNVGGGVPIKSIAQFKHMAPRQKAYAFTTRFAPAMLRTLLRIGVAQIDAMGINDLIHEMYPGGTRDRAALDDPAIAAVMMDGYRFSVAQGYRGFEGDAYIVTRDWSELLPPGSVPICLMHGAHDMVVQPSSVAAFARERGYEHHGFEDEGQLLLYTRPDAVMRRIAAYWDEG